VLFFTLAFGMWLASRAAGVLAIAYVALVISFPRVYLGFHYPTDILGGALIGAVICAGFNLQRVRAPIGRLGIAVKDRARSLFSSGTCVLLAGMARRAAAWILAT
jgi:undecaprenyl-diphosphatase